MTLDRRQPRSSLSTLIAVVVASYVLVWQFNLWFFTSDLSRTLALATAGWLNPNLLMFVPMTMIVLGIVLADRALHPEDLGLRRRDLAAGASVLMGLWVTIQFASWIGLILEGSPPAWHPNWTDPGPGFVLGFLLAMVLGTALFEETVFRGFLLPQLALRLPEGWPGQRRTLVALVLSALIFSVWHVPTLWIHQDLTAPAMAFRLVHLTGAGLLLGLLYLRTGNLFVTMAVHALVNAPTLLLATPLSGSLLAGMLGLTLILFWPGLRRQPLRTPLPVFEAGTNETERRSCGTSP